ncbi:MAG: hypothetical protein AMXMBFR84_30360 [Candidatus Hydrogenedentota bacterium]
MNTHPDFRELLRLLEENNVDYMIVGGYAVAFHGYPRLTKDIDLFFDRTPENVALLRKALIAFGFESKDLPEEAFFTKNLLTFGVPPLRVDLLNEIDGVTFMEARPNIVRGHYGDVSARFIGKTELVKNKRSTNRPQDKYDLEELERIFQT